MEARFRLQAPEELDHRGIDLGGSLLLRPVAAAGKHDGLPQLGHESFQVGDELIHAAEGDHEVTIARDVERGNGHVRPGESCQQLPVAIDVTVPVQPAAKAGTSKFPGVELDVGLRELRREGGRFDGAAENPPCRGTIPTASGLEKVEAAWATSPEPEYKMRRRELRTSRPSSASATPGS